MIHYTQVSTEEELKQILSLQQANLAKNISPEEAQKYGFLTVEHDHALLEKMHRLAPSTIAKDGEKVVGYCLSMAVELEREIPILAPMFEQIAQTTYRGNGLAAQPYMVTGQICVDKAYRGQGIFEGMYEAMRAYFSPQFTRIITEVATRNTRSMKAHAKVGFQPACLYTDGRGEEWAIVV